MYSAIIDEGYLFVGRKQIKKNGKKVWIPFSNREIENMICVSLFRQGLKYSSLDFRDYDPELGVVEIVLITFETTNVLRFFKDGEILIILDDLYCHPDMNDKLTLRVIDKIADCESTIDYLHPLDDDDCELFC
jgi:hypothetical protein